MAEWKSQKLGDIGDIAKVAEGAKGAAEAVQVTLSLASTAMELVKLLAQLQSANPLLLLLNALADEVLSALNDIKEAGYWMLWVDPYYVKNVQAAKIGKGETFGLEIQRDEAGNIIYEMDASGAQKTAAVNGKNIKLPKLVTPFKIIRGGWNPQAVGWQAGEPVDPLTSISTFTKFSTSQVVGEMSNAFDDKGDVAKFQSNDVGKSIAAGETVFDEFGASYSGWDSGKNFGLELYNIGKSDEDGSVIKDFKASRKAINTMLKKGRPNLKGGTADTGFGVGAVAIVIGAPDFDVFVETFNSLGNFFGDVSDFAGGMGKRLSDRLKDLSLSANTVVNVTSHDTNYEKFEVGDILMGESYGGIGEILEIQSESQVIMEREVKVPSTDDAGNITETTQIIDDNSAGRWLDMKLLIGPKKSPNAMDAFWPGEWVGDCEIKGKLADGSPNYVIKGINTRTGPEGERVYSKTAKVMREKLELPPESTPPDFDGIAIKNIIPGWADFFQTLENFVIQLKGMVTDSVGMIQDLIDLIKGVEAFLGEMIAIITKFLKFFSEGLPAAGVYSLYIPNQNEGNKGIQSGLTGASGLPELSYSMGVLFVGVETGGTNPITILANALGLT
jgi:hypothetical protein